MNHQYNVEANHATSNNRSRRKLWMWVFILVGMMGRTLFNNYYELLNIAFFHINNNNDSMWIEANNYKEYRPLKIVNEPPPIEASDRNQPESYAENEMSSSSSNANHKTSRSSSSLTASTEDKAMLSSTQPLLPYSPNTMDHIVDLKQGLTYKGHRNSNDKIKGLFWVIPKSGTSSLKAILSRCLRLKMASSTQRINYNDNSTTVELIDLDDAGRFVNINFGYLDGLQKAKELKMISHPAHASLVDVAVTSYIHEASQIFTSDIPARMFTIVRHPVDRFVSDFYYMKKATWEKTFDESKERAEMTLEEYIHSPNYYVDNWMTRMLSGARGNTVIQKQHLEYAKYVLRHKSLLLFLDEMDEGLRRLMIYMDWKCTSTTIPTISCHDCIHTFLHGTPVNSNQGHPVLDPASHEWNLIVQANSFDMELYGFTRNLYRKDQKKLIENMEQRNRN